MAFLPHLSLLLYLYPIAVACHGLPDEEKVKILDGTKNCTIGQTWLVDHVRYECRTDDRDGEFGTRAFPKNCYDTGGRQIQPGGTWENIQFRFKCIKASQDIMFFYITHCKTPKGQVVPVGSSTTENSRTHLCLRLEDTVKLVTEKGKFCLWKGETIAFDQVWFEGQIQHKCIAEGSEYVVKAIGCKTESGIIAGDGEIVSNGENYVKCNPKAFPIWRKIACVDSKTQEVLPGRSWKDDKFMYKCQKLNSNEFHPEITHCISLMGALIPLNQKKIENSMLFHCVRSPTDNKVTLTQDNRKACVSATGEVYAVGESWNDGHIFYLCDTNAMGDSFVMKECLTENGTSVSPGKIVTVGTDLYRCDPENPDIWIQVACVDANGNEIPPGTTWRSDFFVHLCLYQSDGSYNSAITHCITPAGNMLAINNRALENDQVLKCVKNASGVHLMNDTGRYCVQGGHLHDFGTSWIDGYVQYKCVFDKIQSPLANKTGCRSSNGQTVSIGSVVNILGNNYKCNPNSFEIWSPVACVNDKNEEVLPGHRWKTPQFVYECVATGLNTFIPVITHCITPIGNTVAVGGKINEQGTLLSCLKDPRHGIRITTDQGGFCAHNDYFYTVGQEWFDGYITRKCEAEGNTQVVKIVGCKGANETTVPSGTVVTVNGEIRKCSPADKNVWVKIACVSDTQNEILPGQSWKSAEFVYKCAQSDEDLQYHNVPTHCISQTGLEIPAKTRIDSNGTLLICEPYESQLRLVSSQDQFCKWKGEIFNEGATWYNGAVRFKCQTDGDGQTVAAATGCKTNEGYEANEGELLKISGRYYQCSPENSVDIWMPVACVSRDFQAVDPGRSYQEGKNIFKCVPDGLGRYKSIITHCITSSGTPILAGNKFEEQKVSFNCLKNGSLITESGMVPLPKTNCPAGFKSNLTCSQNGDCPIESYCRKDSNRLGTCCSSIKSATFEQLQLATCKVNIRFRGCLYSSLSAGIFPFANNFNPLHFYNFLLTNRINGRLASPDDNLRQICSSYSNFKFCTSGVNVAECPVTQLYSNWFSLAFDVCKSAERQFPLLSALKCLSTNAFDGNSQSSCSQSAKNLLGQMSADDLTEFGDLRHFCSDVADFIKCLRGSTVNLCGPDGPATFSHAESHVGDLLAGMWGSDCQLEFHTHLSDSGDKINSTVPNSLRR